jgi:glycolate oxidase iron-sulfur subunit
VTPLPENQFCCGGAGAYPLREPEFANRLREPKLAALEQLKPDLLVSANIGCALHISAGLRAQDCLLPVVHPVVLFERQLHAREN